MSTFQNVSLKFLLQTFSKEILAGTHKGKLSLSRGKQTIQDSSADQRIKMEGDILMSEDDVNLLESGAVGVFIQGLEDEFSDVRGATIGTHVC